MDTETTPNDMSHDTFRRIRDVQFLLERIKTLQTEDGAPNVPFSVLPPGNFYLEFLLKNGYIRKIAVAPDDAMPYRIEWKGLCFLDAVGMFDQATQEHTAGADNAAQLFMAKIAVVTFH